MTLFQTYHVNTWISISLLHIISSTSVIKIYQHFTNLDSPHKKRRRIQTQETLHYILDSPPGPVYASPHALGHLPLPCSMKSPTLSTTLNWDDPQPPDPTFIHIKLGWSSPCLWKIPHNYSSLPFGSPTNRFANHRFPRAELRFCSSPSKLQSLMVPSLEAWHWASVFSVTVKSRCQKRWGEPLQQLQV